MRGIIKTCEVHNIIGNAKILEVLASRVRIIREDQYIRKVVDWSDLYTK